MIDGLREYVLHITATALICSVVLRITIGGKTVKMIMKLLCSIVLTCSIIQPIKQIDFTVLGEFKHELQSGADQAVISGKNESQQAFSDSIRKGVEAYIVEKAKAMNVELVVEVDLSDDEIPMPMAVTLKGHAAPYVKSVLSDTISQDLSIPKENQIWISQ